MGQKVHPTGIRLGIVKDWASKWYADSHTFPEYVRTDHELRVFIKEKLKDASVSRITIERPAKKANITIFTARPGIVIGKKGEDIEKLMNKSINQTLSRTFITSGTTLMVVMSLYVFGGDVINTFAFVLLIGILVGTYSSIFVASPSLLWMAQRVTTTGQRQSSNGS